MKNDKIEWFKHDRTIYPPYPIKPEVRPIEQEGAKPMTNKTETKPSAAAMEAARQIALQVCDETETYLGGTIETAVEFIQTAIDTSTAEAVRASNAPLIEALDEIHNHILAVRRVLLLNVGQRETLRKAGA